MNKRQIIISNKGNGKKPKIHPGEILEKEFLEPSNIAVYKLSKAIGVQQARISLIIKGKRGITLDLYSDCKNHPRI